MEPKKPPAGQPANSPTPDSQDDFALNSPVDEFFNRLRSDMRHPLPSQEAISAALHAMQRLAAESVADAGTGLSGGIRADAPVTCQACGYQNRPSSQFCGQCGLPLQPAAAERSPEDPPLSLGSSTESAAAFSGQHHFHHHYHHHYFASGQESGAALAPRTTSADPAAAKLRTPGGGAPMSRVETAVRKVTLDWALACNSRQLDDLVSTYAADALVLRPNHPAVRGTAAIREFFFTALDAGFGEVELDPIRVDVLGDVAYEAGRCKMLVPVVVGKRREERGKYLILLARQTNGEWRIISDCWSSDLSLATAADANVSKPAAVSTPLQKPAPPRKAP